MADVTTLHALNAYQSAVKMADQAQRTGVIPDQASAAAANGQNFWNMVDNSINETINANYAGEKAGVASLNNKVSAADLSIAINNAELTLRTITSIRDRVISAYQDIIKMPI